MASCPHCQTALPDDFGLLECPNCRASVFVDMDGNVIQGSGSNAEAAAATPEQAPEQIQEQELEQFNDEAIVEPTKIVQQTVEEQSVEQVEEEAPIEAEETPAENWQVNSSEEAFADVADFGNQDQIYQQEGPLSYIVTISGIDSKDLENRIKEVLADKKLVIDMERLLPTLKNGSLKISGLNPAKAYVLVSKIYDLPITVEWEQHVLSE